MKHSKKRNTNNKKSNQRNRKPTNDKIQPKPKTISKQEESSEPETIRLNKYIANSGISSRRKADELIKAGNVTVNGEVVLEMGYRVEKTDEVQFKGKVVKPETNKVYLLLNKPKNTITTANDPRGRKTVMDIVGSACKERIFPVGRLDRNTTGLLLFTNDGDLAKKLSHPKHKVNKVYNATLDKKVSPEHLQMIAEGLELEDGKAGVDSVYYIEGNKSEVGIEIHIGKNRIVRRIFEHLGYEVVKLDRVYYGGLTKKNLPKRRFRFLSEREVIMLKHFV